MSANEYRQGLINAGVSIMCTLNSMIMLVPFLFSLILFWGTAIRVRAREDCHCHLLIIFNGYWAREEPHYTNTIRTLPRNQIAVDKLHDKATSI